MKFESKAKKSVSLLLSFLMIISLFTALPFTAGAVNTDKKTTSATNGDFEYLVFDDGTAEITGYYGSATELEVPNIIDGYTVLYIGYRAFKSCNSITDVIIPNSVTSIGVESFANCANIRNVKIGNSVTSIGYSAFIGCTNLTNVIIPNNVTNICGNALGYYATEQKISDSFTITGYSGTEAERYAKDNEFTFISLGKNPGTVVPKETVNINYGDKIYFDNSKLKWNNVYIFIWGKDVEWSSWPGTLMTKLSNDVWGIALEDSVYQDGVESKYTNIIFSNGEGGVQSTDLQYEGDSFIAIPDGRDGFNVRWEPYTKNTFNNSFTFHPGEAADNNPSWYVWTWSLNGIGGKFILGEGEGENIKFNGVGDMVVFLRMEPGAQPDWNTCWNRTGDIAVQGSDAYFAGWSGEVEGIDAFEVTWDNGGDITDPFVSNPTTVAPTTTIKYGRNEISFGKTIEGIEGKRIKSLLLLDSDQYGIGDLKIESLDKGIVDINVISIGEGDYKTSGNEKIATVYLDLKSVGTTFVLIKAPDGTTENVTVNVSDSLSEFQLGRDNNSFYHYASSELTSGFYGIENYGIYSSDIANNLFNLAANKSEYSLLLEIMKEKWNGSCYGLAQVIGLTYLKNIDLNQISNKNADDFYDLSKPCNDDKLLDTIEYYQLSQYLKKYGPKSKNCYSTYFGGYDWLNRYNNSHGYNNFRIYSNTDFYKLLIDAVKENYMVLLGYAKKNSDGHAILTCGISETSDNSYTIKLYDENHITEFDELKITENNGELTAQYICSGDGGNKLMDEMVSMYYIPLSAVSNIKPYTLSKTYTPQTMTVTISIGQKFKITTDDGQYLTFDGNKLKGDIEIYDIQNIVNTNDCKIQLEIKKSQNIIYESKDKDTNIVVYDDNNYYSLSGKNIDFTNIDFYNGLSMSGDNYTFKANTNKINDDKIELVSISGNSSDSTNINIDENNNVCMKSDSTVNNLNVEVSNIEESKTIVNNSDTNGFELSEDNNIIIDTVKPTENTTTPAQTESTTLTDTSASTTPTKSPTSTETSKNTTNTTNPVSENMQYTFYYIPELVDVVNGNTFKINLEDINGKCYTYSFKPTDKTVNGQNVYVAEFELPENIIIKTIQYQVYDNTGIVWQHQKEFKNIAYLSDYNAKVYNASTDTLGELIFDSPSMTANTSENESTSTESNESTSATTPSESTNSTESVTSTEPYESSSSTSPSESTTITGPATTESTESTTVTKPSATTNPTENTTATEPTETTPKPAKTTVTLKKSSATVYVKATAQIKATVKNGKGKTIYKTSNKKVAKVNSSGKVTGVKKGTATITVTNNGVSKKFKVTVKNPKLNKSKLTLKKGKSFKLSIKGKVGKAKFTSSNKKVATVSKKGNIKAKKKGKATITVKTNGMKLKCKIKVR